MLDTSLPRGSAADDNNAKGGGRRRGWRTWSAIIVWQFLLPRSRSNANLKLLRLPRYVLYSQLRGLWLWVNIPDDFCAKAPFNNKRCRWRKNNLWCLARHEDHVWMYVLFCRNHPVNCSPDRGVVDYNRILCYLILLLQRRRRCRVTITE